MCEEMKPEDDWEKEWRENSSLRFECSFDLKTDRVSRLCFVASCFDHEAFFTNVAHMMAGCEGALITVVTKKDGVIMEAKLGDSSLEDDDGDGWKYAPTA